VPVGHDVHVAEPDAEYELAPHCWQLPPDADLVPAEQGSHLCLLVVVEDPAGQAAHNWSGAQRKLPSSQEEHEVAPEALSVPNGQGVHVDDFEELTVLSGHGWHSSLPPLETVLAAQVLQEVALAIVL